MDDLIEALTIFRKYSDDKWPTHCEHDKLMICCVDPEEVSDEDTKRLDELGFIIDHEYGEDAFISFRFGSC